MDLKHFMYCMIRIAWSMC